MTISRRSLFAWSSLVLWYVAMGVGVAQAWRGLYPQATYITVLAVSLYATQRKS